jgi:hypothetical protein
MGEADRRIAIANTRIDAEPSPRGGATGPFGRMERLCSALTRSLPAWGAGVSLLTDDSYRGGPVAASGPGIRRVEELPFTLGEGPCMDAYSSRRPVLEPDLVGRGMARWPAYAAAAQEEGVRAVFALPLQIGAARAGALDIYRDEPGALTQAALAQAFTFAEIAMGLLLDTQAGAELGHTPVDLDDALAYRLEVYQAQGMVMVDLEVSLDEAMARLRGYAYAHARNVSDVARDVVAGNLRLTKDRA